MAIAIFIALVLGETLPSTQQQSLFSSFLCSFRPSFFVCFLIPLRFVKLDEGTSIAMVLLEHFSLISFTLVSLTSLSSFLSLSFYHCVYCFINFLFSLFLSINRCVYCTLMRERERERERERTGERERKDRKKIHFAVFIGDCFTRVIRASVCCQEKNLEKKKRFFTTKYFALKHRQTSFKFLLLKVGGIWVLT